MQVFGTTEAATRALSLMFALLAVPASFWAGAALFDRRAGALAAAGAAGSPFLTYYAQETRMYSLVVLLSILASASFVLAFVRGDRRHVPLPRPVAGAAALHAHVGPVPDRGDGRRVAGAVAARRGRGQRRRAARRGARADLRCRGCRRSSSRPRTRRRRGPSGRRRCCCSGFPGGLFGHFAVPLLALAVFFALRRRPPVDRAVRVLAGIAIATAGFAWLCSQIQPAWANRYLAVAARPAAAGARVGRVARDAAGRRSRWPASPSCG